MGTPWWILISTVLMDSYEYLVHVIIPTIINQTDIKYLV